MEKLRPGDACEECLNQGINHKLRYFYINLEEQLLKCESRHCLWPHNDEVSSSSDDEECESLSKPDTTNVNDVDDADNFIVQLLQQLAPETTEEPATEICSMPDLTTDSYEQMESMLSANEPVYSSPKSTTLLPSNDKLLSTTTTAADTPKTTTTSAVFSMPNLLTETSQLSINSLPQKSDSSGQEIQHSIIIAASSTVDSIDFKISLPNAVPELNTPIAIPKADLFQPLKKACTLQQKPKPVLPPAASVSTYVNKQQRPTKPARIKRSVATGPGLIPRTQLVKQLMQSIEAKQKEKQLKTQAEQELAKAAKQTL